MGNYVIEEEIGNYSRPNDYSTPRVKPKKSINKKKLLIGIIFIIIVLITIFLIKNGNFNSYSSFEKKLVNLAKEYVDNNGITTSGEMYIDVSKLNAELPNSCSLLSGVIYDGNSFEPYLLCRDYESEIVDNSEYKTDFKLVGNSVVFLLKNMEYYELGYECSEPVTISSSNINGEGVYNIYYILDDSNFIFIRKVIIIDNPSLSNLFPAINLSSEDPVTIELGNIYDESPVAIDAVDGDLTSKINRVGNVDVNKEGEYKIIYSVRNSLGYTTNVMRKVLVVDNINSEISVMTSLNNDNLTSENIQVSVSVIGNNYDYTELPNGDKTNEREFEYSIEENGKYEFVAVSKNGEETVKTLNITNIDRSIPEGECVATLYSDRTSISVTMKSFNYVVGYNYYVDDSESGYIDYNFYNSSKKNPSNIYVVAKDYIGNEGKIVCTKTDKQSNFDPNGIRTLISKGKKRLRIPIATALANKKHNINELNMCIYNRVKEAGPYTRYGVAAAAFGLIDCTYNMTGMVLSYDHTGGKVEGGYCSYNSDICGKLGVNTRWGKSGGTCNSDDCWFGLNCATFVRWAMCNGGMNLCSRGSAASHGMTSTTYFPEADGVYVKGSKVTYYSGTNLTNYTANTLVRMLKPGDLIASSEGGGHTFVIVGRDDNGIYTAEDGYYMRNLSYSELVSGKQSYRLLFLDNYYANVNNRNNLYN